MLNDNLKDLMVRFGTPKVDEKGRNYIGMHRQSIRLHAFFPYGAFTCSLLQPTEDPMSSVLVLNDGLIRPTSSEFEKTGTKTPSLLSNTSVEDMCIRAFSKCMVNNEPIDYGVGGDPPDRIFSLRGLHMNLEITSVALHTDRQVEAGLDRIRTQILKKPSPSYLKDTYLVLSLSKIALEGGEKPDGVFTEKIVNRICETLTGKNFRSALPTLKKSLELFEIDGSPIAIRASKANVPFRSKFYQQVGFEFINGFQMVVSSTAYSGMLQKCLDQKDVSTNDSLLIVHGIPDKKGLMFPRESALVDLINPSLIRSLRKPSYLRNLFLMRFPKQVEWYRFEELATEHVGTFQDPTKEKLKAPEDQHSDYSYKLNVPFFDGKGQITGSSNAP